MKALLAALALAIPTLACARRDETIPDGPPADPQVLVGARVSLVGFPKSYFLSPNPLIPAKEHLRLVEIQHALLGEMYGFRSRITFVYDADPHCGASSDSRRARIKLCQSYSPENLEHNTFPWMVTAHEMSHAMLGGASPAALALFEGGYSAFLDEHQAEVSPEYVHQKMQERAAKFNLSAAELAGLRQSNDLNRDIQARALRQYTRAGKHFSIAQQDIPGATLTGQATSAVVILLTMSLGTDAIVRFNRALSDPALRKAKLTKRSSQDEVANYVVAAWSAAFGRDLRAMFKAVLNYPVSDGLYERYCRGLDAASPACASSEPEPRAPPE